MRYRFKRSSPLFIIAVLLYFAISVGHYFFKEEAFSYFFVVLYAIAGLMMILLAKGKKQWGLLLPMGFLVAFFLAPSIIAYRDINFDYDVSFILYLAALVLVSLGFLTFFVALFAPKVRYVSAGAYLLAFSMYVVTMLFLEGRVDEGFGLWGFVILLSSFMVPQALHALTPRTRF